MKYSLEFQGLIFVDRSIFRASKVSFIKTVKRIKLICLFRCEHVITCRLLSAAIVSLAIRRFDVHVAGSPDQANECVRFQLRQFVGVEALRHERCQLQQDVTRLLGTDLFRFGQRICTTTSSSSSYSAQQQQQQQQGFSRHKKLARSFTNIYPFSPGKLMLDIKSRRILHAKRIFIYRPSITHETKLCIAMCADDVRAHRRSVANHQVADGPKFNRSKRVFLTR